MDLSTKNEKNCDINFILLNIFKFYVGKDYKLIKEFEWD